MAKFMWTQERTLLLIKLKKNRLSYKVIADRIGCRPEQAKNKVFRMTSGVDARPEEPERITRNCLGCGGVFTAPTRFIRTCDACKATSNWRQGNDFSARVV